jgi:hypothetical protein
MRKTLMAAIAVSAGLGGFTGFANAGLFSATGNVIAVMGGELFVGEAIGNLNGSGTIAIHSQANPALTCAGDFTSSKELGGSGTLACSDGATSTFRFKRLTVYRGFGTGTFSRGDMSFAYGIPPNEAQAYLKLPEGKKLAQNGTQLAMVDQ